MTRFVEKKEKPGGKVLEYEVDLVHRSASVAIVRFEMKQGGGPPRLPIEVPAGSVSYGYFWPRRPYSLYRWISPEGDVVAHRFDAVTDVRMTESEVAYRDLVLDWWVFPDDTLIEEDRDELEELLASGTITPAEAARANEAARQVFSRYRHIIDEVVELERRWVR
jgi:predicted RNA-binding protein associated with RNAse of E/G family